MRFGRHPILTLTALTTYTANTGMVEVAISPLLLFSNESAALLPRFVLDNFTQIGVIDSMRADGETKMFSLATGGWMSG